MTDNEKAALVEIRIGLDCAVERVGGLDRNTDPTFVHLIQTFNRILTDAGV